MYAKCLVELFRELEFERANNITEAFDRDGTDLLGLRIGVDTTQLSAVRFE